MCELAGNQPPGELVCPACGGKFALRLPPESLLAPDPPAARPPSGAGSDVVPGAGAAGVGADPAGLAPGWRAGTVTAEEPMRPLTLEGGPPLAWVDRVLPSRPHWFLLVVVGLSVGLWLLGFLLAADRAKFLQSREWYAQLLYLPAHFIALRLFVTLYTRNFMAGVRHLTVPHDLAWRRMRWVLGPVGLLSVLLAAPLSARDFFELSGDKYRDSLVGPVKEGGGVTTVPDAEGIFFGWPEGTRPLSEGEVLAEGHLLEPEDAVGAADLLMWGIWSLEWLINAYIWVLLLGFLALTMHILRTYTFRDPVEVVLHQKQYRPFLLMSGQGASIVLGFAAANALYVWFAQGTITDYIGITVTIALLVLGFCPPWLQIKSSVEKVVHGEVYRLREGLIAEHRHQAILAKQGVLAGLDLNTRVSEALVILRIDYLERLSQQLGRNEGVTLLLKLLAPLATVGWRFVRLFVGLP
jgi:hypothetical protein